MVCVVGGKQASKYDRKPPAHKPNPTDSQKQPNISSHPSKPTVDPSSYSMTPPIHQRPSPPKQKTLTIHHQPFTVHGQDPARTEQNQSKDSLISSTNPPCQDPHSSRERTNTSTTLDGRKKNQESSMSAQHYSLPSHLPTLPPTYYIHVHYSTCDQFGSGRSGKTGTERAAQGVLCSVWEGERKRVWVYACVCGVCICIMCVRASAIVQGTSTRSVLTYLTCGERREDEW